MDTIRKLYAIVIENICKARNKKPQQNEMKPHSFKVNDMVLVKDPDSAVFEPRYQPNYRVMAIFGDNRIDCATVARQGNTTKIWKKRETLNTSQGHSRSSV